VDISVNQVHTMVQTFHTGDAVFQDDNSPIHTARSVQALNSMEMHFIIVPGQHNCQT